MPVRKLALCALALVLLLAASAPSPTPGNLMGITGLTITGAGTWTGVMMFGIYLLREWRETRKLSSADRLARREGYAKQVENLQGENRRLRGDIAGTEKRHTEYRRTCQAETDQLRGEIRHLEEEVFGLKRALAAQGQTYARAVVDGVHAPTTTGRVKRGEA